jgi:hypothetical protein
LTTASRRGWPARSPRSAPSTRRARAGSSSWLSPEGKPFVVKDSKGHVTYDSKKGDFTLAENVVPEYVWFDGTVTYTLQEDRIDPGEVLRINRFLGGPDDPKARIWPVKRLTGRQPYDVEHRQLLALHTAIPDDSAFWFHFDWPKALRAGAEASGMPFSGRYDFVRTEMLWPITHMVAPKEQSVKCGQCHSAAGRMGDLRGIDVPGRDRQPVIDALGWGAAALALAGVLVHAAARVLARRRRRMGAGRG